MTTEAQILTYVRRNSAGLTLLAELDFGYESGGAPAVGTLYLADRTFRTGGGDSPPNTRYRSCIDSAPDFSRAVDVRKLGGRGVQSVGSLVLANADGEFDFLLNAILDGYEVRFLIGDSSWQRLDFYPLNTAVVAAVKANDLNVTLELRDKALLLDVPVIGAAIATGPNAGKPKPLAFGYVYNLDLTPYLLSEVDLTYYINNFALDSNTPFDTLGLRVRDAGGSLDSGVLWSFATLAVNTATETLTRVAHGFSVNDVIYLVRQLSGGGSLPGGLNTFTQYWVIAAGLTADDFRLSLTKGGSAVDLTSAGAAGNTYDVYRRRFHITPSTAILQLSSDPVGRPTMDYLAADAAGAFTIAQPHKVFKYLVQTFTRLDAADIDTAAMDALATLEQATIYISMAVTDRTNLMDLLDAIATLSRSWYAFTAAGVLTVGRFDLANLDAVVPDATITDAEIVGEVQVENLPLPWGKIVLDAAPNVVQQTDGLITTVDPEDRTAWAHPYQVRATTTDPVGATYPNDWWTYHKSAIDSQPIGVPLGAPGDPLTVVPAVAQVAVDAMTEEFRPNTRVARLSVGLDHFLRDPGDCIAIDRDRLLMDGGVNFRLASIGVKYSRRECEMTFVRRQIPEYATGSYA